MKTFEQLAKEGYEAFLKARKQAGSTGTDYLRWDMLSAEQQSCWLAATKQILAAYAVVH